MDLSSINEQNEYVQKWSSKVVRRMKNTTRQFTKGKAGAYSVIKTKRTEEKLTQSLNYRIGKEYGLVEYVGIRLERHGVFVHKGVGRGYIMENGVVKRGIRPDKQTKMYAKAKGRDAPVIASNAPIRRKPVEWFNPVLDQMMPELADKLAEINADAALNFEKAKIH